MVLDFFLTALISGLIGGAISDIIPGKIAIYLVSLLMAVAGLFFGYIFSFMIYNIIIGPKDTTIVVFMSVMSLFLLALSIGSFYLMVRAWMSKYE